MAPNVIDGMDITGMKKVTVGVDPIQGPQIPINPVIPRSPWYLTSIPNTAIVNPDTIANFSRPGLPIYRVTPPQPLTAVSGGSNSSVPTPTTVATLPQPPAPAISVPLTTTNVGYQFTFLQVNIPTSLPPSATISSYKVYRSSSNTFNTATVVQTIPHNPANGGGPVVVQDVQPVGAVEYYWVSCVNVSGVESTPTPAQTGSVTSGSQLNSSGQLSSMDQIANDGTNFVRTPTGTAPGVGAGPMGGPVTATTTDTTINYGNTVAGSAAIPGAINTTRFYVRWVGFLIPSVTGTYTIGVNTDDGANLFVQGKPLVLNLATTQAANSSLAYTQSGTMYLAAGTYYSLVLEWQQGINNYECQLAWTPPGGSIQLIPAANLSTSNTSVTSNIVGNWWNGTASVWFPTGNHYIDFAANHINKQLDNVPDGTTYARTVASDQTTNRIDFSKALLNKQLDNIPDGTTYLRTSQFVNDVVIDNGNFEASASLPPPGWTNYNSATLSYDTSTQYSGAQSLKVVTSSASGGAITARKYACRSGDQIYFACRAKAAAGTATIEIDFRDGSGNLLSVSQAQTTSSSWTLIQNTATAPSGTTYFNVYVYQVTAVSATLEFDEVYVRYVRNIDNEVNDGSVYARIVQSASTSNQPISSVPGLNLLSNNDFPGGNTNFIIPGNPSGGGYVVYDNNATGNVHVTAINSGLGITAAVPNHSKYVLKVLTNGGSLPTPGNGGFTVQLGPDGGTSQIGAYHRGNNTLWRMMAIIPKSLTVQHAANSLGSDVNAQWIGTQTGQGANAYYPYVYRERYGTFGTFSTTGFFYTTINNGATSTYNLIPDADNMNGTWTQAGGSAWAYQPLFGVGNRWLGTWELTGNGSPTGFNYVASGTITVSASTTYTVSYEVDTTHVTGANNFFVGVYDTSISTAYGTDSVPNGYYSPNSGRRHFTFTTPAGVTQVRFIFDSGNCTVTNGNFIFAGTPQLELGSTMNEFIPNPIVWFVASLDAIDQDVSQQTAAPYNLLTQGQSTTLNAQGSVLPGQALTISWTDNTTSISLSWANQSMLRPDNTSLSVLSGTQNYTGLTAGSTYYIYPYINSVTGVVGFVNGSPPPTSGSATFAIQAALDGRIFFQPLVITIPNSGSGSGSGGGGGSCPEKNELVEVKDKGVLKAWDVEFGDYIKGYSFTQKADVYRRVIGRQYHSCAAWYKVDGHKVTPCEPVYYQDKWTPAYKIPSAEFDAEPGVLLKLTVDADSDAEHNYWLVGGTPLLMHNWQPFC